MNKRTKLERGVTLIALVITIIVLLILAGVTVSMLTGENGILKKATNAKAENEKSSALELANIYISEYLIDAKQKNQQFNLKEFQTYYEDNEDIEIILYGGEIASILDNLQEIDNITNINITPNYAKIELNQYPNYMIVIDANLKVKEINGEKVLQTENEGENQTSQNQTSGGQTSEEDEKLNITDNDVEKLFEISAYNLNLEELLTNKEIVEKISNNAELKDYIKNSDEIYSLAYTNVEVAKTLKLNSNLFELLKDDLKWKSIINPDNLVNHIEKESIKASCYHASYLPEYAFDNKWEDSGLVWSTYNTGDQEKYIICQFDTEVLLREFEVKSGTINNEYLKDFTIYGSNDDENYEIIYSDTHGNNSEFETFYINNKKLYQYLKFEINSGYNSNVSIAEIRYKGELKSDTKEIEYIGNHYKEVNQILNKIDDLISLDNILQNKEIMEKILLNSEARKYIIESNSIYEKAATSRKILETLRTNSDMNKEMSNDSKWSKLSTPENLTRYIINISSSYYYSSYKDEYAFDGEVDNSNHVWSTYPTGGIDQYIICEFSKLISLKQIEIQSGTINQEYLKDFTIYGSKDGEIYERIYSGTHGNNNEMENFEINDSNSYKYLKLEINSKYNNNVSLQEIIYTGYVN